MKKCVNCGKLKNEDDFDVYKSGGIRKKRKECKICRRDMAIDRLRSKVGKIDKVISIFETPNPGQQIVKLYVKNGKMVVDYET